MVIQYKCQSCGADMAFNSSTGMLHCDSCGRDDTIESYNKGTNSKSNTKEANHTFNTNESNEFHCNSCGATVITDPLTTATNCSFCGSNMVLSNRLEGRQKPEYIIPFKISKEQAMEAFRTWCKKGLLTPSGFMTADRVKSITGLYVPFWLYDVNCDGEALAHCTKVRTYEQGDYIYTETKHYEVHRQVNLSYDLVPADASEKMDDLLMEKIEPFHYDSLTNFNMPYLAGFLAENYSYDSNALFPKIKSRVHSYVSSFIRNTITGYTTVNIQHENIEVHKNNVHYVLFPVWMVCYDYKKSEHTFAMNGQTGKIVGKPPLSIYKIILWFLGISLGSFLIMIIATFLLGGGV